MCLSFKVPLIEEFCAGTQEKTTILTDNRVLGVKFLSWNQPKHDDVLLSVHIIPGMQPPILIPKGLEIQEEWLGVGRLILEGIPFHP